MFCSLRWLVRRLGVAIDVDAFLGLVFGIGIFRSFLGVFNEAEARFEVTWSNVVSSSAVKNALSESSSAVRSITSTAGFDLNGGGGGGGGVRVFVDCTGADVSGGGRSELLVAFLLVHWGIGFAVGKS